MNQNTNLKPDYTCGQKFATFYKEDIPSCLRTVADYLEQNDLEIATGLIDQILIDKGPNNHYSVTFPCGWIEKYD